MLTSLRLKYFKAFEQLDLEIRPITIFIGPNNSGKSSIIASLRVLVQTIESYDTKIPLLLNGTMGDFGTNFVPNQLLNSLIPDITYLQNAQVSC
jgi:AAA15 family ATPase/GTPase